MNSKYVWPITCALIFGLIGYTAFGLIYPKLPVVEVEEYNDTPANHRDGFGKKDIFSDQLPAKKLNHKYKYIITSPDGNLLDGQRYLLHFGAGPDGDAVVKKKQPEGKEYLIIFSDLTPDAFSRDFRELARSKWMRMVGRTLPADTN